MLKIIGSILIIIGTGVVGLKRVVKIRNHERSLSSVCAGLELLESEISDMLTPTKEALENVIQSHVSPFGKFVSNVLMSFDDLSQKSLYLIWNEALENTKELVLNEKEKMVLSELGHILGRYSSYEQKKLIEYCKRRFEDAHKASIRELEKDSKVHAVLSLAAGNFISIIFI